MPECLDSNYSNYDSPCEGPVEFRIAMSPTGIQYPRCDKHYEQRRETQKGISERYDVPMYYYEEQGDDF